MSDAQAPRSVDPSHLPTVIDLLETERDALRAEIERLRDSVRQHTNVSTELAQGNAALCARLALLEPVFAAAKAWRNFVPHVAVHAEGGYSSTRNLVLAVDAARAGENK